MKFTNQNEENQIEGMIVMIVMIVMMKEKEIRKENEKENHITIMTMEKKRIIFIMTIIKVMKMKNQWK